MWFPLKVLLKEVIACLFTNEYAHRDYIHKNKIEYTDRLIIFFSDTLSGFPIGSYKML